jgi:ABC-type oligopeptide transport system ATPase subunit
MVRRPDVDDVPWEQGEHVSVVGDTGSGKTFLLSRLLPLRGYVVFLKTKADSTVDRQFQGFAKIRTVAAMSVSEHYYVLDPSPGKRTGVFEHFLEKALAEGGWTVAIDELFYAQNKLGLGSYIEEFLTQGRSQGLTVVAGMQRPVSVTRFALAESTWTFVFSQEGRDAKTVAEVTTPRMRPEVETLNRYEFACFNRKTRRIVRGRAQGVVEVMEALT